MSLEDRIESESKTMVRVTNNDLVCRDCVLRFPDNIRLGNTTKCEIYPDMKPHQVLLGGKCSEYVKE